MNVKTLGHLALWRAVSLMPESLAYRTMETVFARGYRSGGSQVRRLRETFAPIVEPEQLEPTVRDAFRWYGRYWAEAFRLPGVPSETLTARFTIDGQRNIEEALEAGRGAVLATLHQGNWDTGGRWVSERWPLTAVAERLEPKVMTDRFIAYRRKLGMDIITLEEGADVTARCVEVVERNELLALLADRDLSGRGVPVSFFGKEARMAPGPAVIAARTGCRILPAVIYQDERGHHHAVVNQPIPGSDDGSPEGIQATTQRIAEAYEGFIRHAPAQWHMFQRFWPESA